MTPAELRALLAKATPGTWLCPNNPESVVDIWRQGGVLPDVPEWEHSNAITPEIRGRDAELIVAMHAALPALLDAVEAAERLFLAPTGDEKSSDWIALKVALAKLATP